jgi:hypothetical protein
LLSVIHHSHQRKYEILEDEQHLQIPQGSITVSNINNVHTIKKIKSTNICLKKMEQP